MSSLTESTSSVATAPPEQTIQQVDLGSRSFTVGDTGATVTLDNGTSTDEYGRTTILADTVYADADGDGFPDAAVEIQVTDGNGFEALWYILLWDRATQQPVQIDDPFARTFRCGDVVDSVEPAARGFTVTEHRTEGDLASCADQPPIAITRTVGARDGFLAELSPNQGYGGICPHAIGDDGNHTPPADLRIAPTDDAPPIGDQAVGAWLLSPPDHSTYVGVDGWRLLGYSTTGTDETWYSSCAWAPD